MTQEKATYKAWMLRIYHGENRWQATLECPHTGKRIAFNNPQRLLAFINRQPPPAVRS